VFATPGGEHMLLLGPVVKMCAAAAQWRLRLLPLATYCLTQSLTNPKHQVYLRASIISTDNELPRQQVKLHNGHIRSNGSRHSKQLYTVCLLESMMGACVTIAKIFQDVTKRRLPTMKAASKSIVRKS